MSDFSPPLPRPRRNASARLRVRVLDPANAVRRGSRSLTPTAYVGDSLLLTGEGPDDEAVTVIRSLLEGQLDVECSCHHGRRSESDTPTGPRSTRLTLSRCGDQLGSGVDAWQVLQNVLTSHPDLEGRVALNHVMTAADPYWDPVPY